MKIVQINTVSNGCTGRIANSLNKVLKENGHECILAYGRGESIGDDNYKISNFLDSNVHGLLTRVFDSTGLHSKTVTRKFLRFLDEYKPDVVHIHNLHGYYINYQILFDYLKSKNIKVFWTLHDCWPFTGHCPYYTYVDCHKWETGCHDCQQKIHHPTSYMVDRSENNYRDKKEAFCGIKNMTLITPSLWLKKEVEKSFLKEYQVLNIPNGISMTDFKCTENHFRKKHGLEDRILILGVANLWAETKGMRFFLQLNERLPHEKYQIALVGLSEKQMRTLPKTIIGIKKTENLQELADIYSSADIFINPTLEDNFPTTNIESLACGTPVITFNTGGSPEALDCSCGIVVDKDIDQLLNACKTMGRKTKERQAACIAKGNQFDEKICFRRYLKLYEATE